MKIRQSILVTVFMSGILGVYGQSLKTYNGKYNDKGKVEYQYFEDENYERILQGSFIYNEEEYISKKRNYTGLIIKGNYKNNLKNGLWIYKKIENKKVKFKNPQQVLLYSLDYINYYGTAPNYDDFPVIYLNTPINKTISLKGNYVSGFKNGLWTIVGKNNGEISYDCKIIFNMDTLVGEYVYNTPSVSEIGQFNNHGFKIGTWKHKTEEEEVISKYQDGYLYWQLKRNNVSGKIISKFDYSNKIDSLKKGLPVLIDNVKYVLRIDNKRKDDVEWFGYSNIVNDLFDIVSKGNSNNNRSLIPRKILFDYSLTPQGKLDIKYNDIIKDANSYFQRQDYSNAISEYKKALKLKADKEYPKKQIQKCNQLSYDSFINVANRYFDENKYEEAIDKYKSASQILINEKYPIEQINKCKELSQRLNVISSNHNKIKNQYLSSKKKYILDAYLIIYGNTDLFSKKYEDLDLLIRFQKKTIELINVKTKLIKKRLKNEGTDVKTILDIFEIK